MATRARSLHIYEEVMLLALRNDKGTVAGGTMYQQAAGGAILAELILDDRVRVVTEGRSTYGVVQDQAPLRDAVLDECLQRMATDKRRRKLSTWVERFSNTSRLKHRVAMGLVDKGILRMEEKSVLLIFSRRVYPEIDPTHERRILERLRDAIASDDGVVDARTTVLIALGHHASLLKANLDRKSLRARRRRIEAIVNGDAVGKATQQAIEAVQAAIMVAAIMPAMVASSSS
jgi:Golgi phosphoprotein 3